ncbi:cytidine deaminase-like protein [Rickenella mellea]|uniref:Cytidine deaminase-like protein n=1 Tax=Rickenella mellea TaxID=50990 RepID=A0A4Y7QKE7_9AGAM|nr:cytidine deaminase-like protein [Rickenella mellea]
MSDLDQKDFHLEMMRLALTEARKSTPSPSAFCVGCVLIARWPDESSSSFVLSSGFSRELPGNTHAEANALTKAKELSRDHLSHLTSSSSLDHTPAAEELFRMTDVYTTMEPCSVRTSGLPPCSEALIGAGVRRCFIGVREPDDFVNCEGARKLQDAGIDVVWLSGMEEACLRVARATDLSE